MRTPPVDNDFIRSDSDEFMPISGKHKEFDEIEEEIKSIDKQLKKKLEGLRKQVK